MITQLWNLGAGGAGRRRDWPTGRTLIHSVSWACLLRWSRVLGRGQLVGQWKNPTQRFVGQQITWEHDDQGLGKSFGCSVPQRRIVLPYFRVTDLSIQAARHLASLGNLPVGIQFDCKYLGRLLLMRTRLTAVSHMYTVGMDSATHHNIITSPAKGICIWREGHLYPVQLRWLLKYVDRQNYSSWTIACPVLLHWLLHHLFG